MVAGFISERWPASNRNPGRLHVEIPGRLKSESAVRPSSDQSPPDVMAKKNEVQPMQLPMHQAPRCGAKTRRGKPCQSPAMANGRCRMHGGPSPGAPKGNKNAFKHGRYSALS